MKNMILLKAFLALIFVSMTVFQLLIWQYMTSEEFKADVAKQTPRPMTFGGLLLAMAVAVGPAAVALIILQILFKIS
jgi:hypothetical protein